MKEKKRNIIAVAVLLVFLIALTCMFFFFESTPTGLTVYEEQILEQNQGIETVVISASKINDDGESENKTFEIQTKDGNFTNLNKNSMILDVTFENSLNNSDIISLYLLQSNNVHTNVYLCDENTTCDFPGYGSVQFDEEEGWYNITISNLSSPKNTLAIDPPNNIKIDYIKAIRFEDNYTNTTCTENWNISFGECLINDTQLKYYVDQNECGTMDDLPNDNGTYVSCDYCALNNCSGSFQDLISFDENETVEIYGAGAKLEINSSSNENATFTVVGYNWTSKDVPTDITAVNKYLEIESDITGVNSVKIIIYYTDEELLNINEETLKINYYNETSGEWEELESVVNTTGNYIYAIVSHLSLYGLFGEEVEEEETTQSSSFSISRKYGRSSKRESTTTVIEEAEEIELETNDLETELSLESDCDYDLEISLPETIPLFKQDFYVGEIINKGNCDIPKLNIYPDPELSSFASFSPSTIENLNQGDTKTFQITRNNEKKGWFSYLTGSAVAENIIIKKIKGTIIIEGREGNKALFAKGSALNMEVISSEKIVSAVKKVSLVTIEVFAVLVVFLLLFRKFKKKKK